MLSSDPKTMLQVPIGTPVQLTEELRLRDGSPFGLMYTFRLAFSTTRISYLNTVNE